MAFFVYILECADGSYYLGHTDDLQERVAQHESGAVAGYTESRLPVQLVWYETFSTRYEALQCERQIKGWSRAKKAALIRADWAQLQALARSRSPARGSTSSPRTGSAGALPMSPFVLSLSKDNGESPPDEGP